MAEKDSDEAVTMDEKESDETVTMSRADTINRTKRGGGIAYNSKNASGARAQRATEVQANEDQAKLPWFRGLIL